MDVLVDRPLVGIRRCTQLGLFGLIELYMRRRKDSMSGKTHEVELRRGVRINTVEFHLLRPFADVHSVLVVHRVFSAVGFDAPGTADIHDANFAALKKKVGGHFLFRRQQFKTPLRRNSRAGD